MESQREGCSSPLPSNESVILKEDNGFTGVDLYGCYINNISIFAKVSRDANEFNLRPTFVISGRLGLPLHDCPECLEHPLLDDMGARDFSSLYYVNARDRQELPQTGKSTLMHSQPIL